MKTYLFLILLSSLPLSCANRKHAEGGINDSTKESKTEEVNKVDEPKQVFPSQERSFFASINRGACYGKCPIYAMKIYSDGHVELTGTRFMEPIGDFTGQISKEQIQLFMDKAQEIGFFQLEDVYDSPVTDIPAITTSIVINGKQKTVMRRVGYPERIREFENLFDELLKTVDWKAIEQ